MIRVLVRRIFDRRKKSEPCSEERRRNRMTPARATEQLIQSIDNLTVVANRIQGKETK